MKFAKWVFRISGIYGVAVITPLWFTESSPQIVPIPPLTHPEFYYGFTAVTLAWQVAFLVSSLDPVRYLLLMIVTPSERVISVSYRRSPGRGAFVASLLPYIPNLGTYPARPRNTSMARSRRNTSSSSSWPVLDLSFVLGTVVSLSTIKRLTTRRPFNSVGSTAIRNSCASVGSDVKAQTVTEGVASK